MEGKISIELQVKCPRKILEALKDPVLSKKCSTGRWFLKLEKTQIRFLYSDPGILVGVLMNAEIVKDKSNGEYIVERIFIDPKIRYANPRGQDNDKRTTEEIAIDVLNECFNEIDEELL